MATVSRLSNSILRQAYAANTKGVRLGENYPKELVDDIFACALKKQTGVSLKYMYVYNSFLVGYGFVTGGRAGVVGNSEAFLRPRVSDYGSILTSP